MPDPHFFACRGPETICVSTPSACLRGLYLTLKRIWFAVLATEFAAFGLSAAAAARGADADIAEVPSVAGIAEALRSVDMIRAGCVRGVHFSRN